MMFVLWWVVLINVVCVVVMLVVLLVGCLVFSLVSKVNIISRSVLYRVNSFSIGCSRNIRIR